VAYPQADPPAARQAVAGRLDRAVAREAAAEGRAADQAGALACSAYSALREGPRVLGAARAGATMPVASTATQAEGATPCTFTYVEKYDRARSLLNASCEIRLSHSKVGVPCSCQACGEGSH
jgi:hypothetical protein